MCTSCRPSCKLDPPLTRHSDGATANIASLLKGSYEDIDALALHPGVIFPACLWSPPIPSLSSADLNASRSITHMRGANPASSKCFPNIAFALLLYTAVILRFGSYLGSLGWMDVFLLCFSAQDFI